MVKRSSGLLKLAAVIVAAGLWPAQAPAQKAPDAALAAIKVAPGLEVTTWATEPLLVKPTNMDIDAKGRIWVTEGANYRSSKTRAEGDRIVILEDTTHSGKADNYKVFVQDPQLASPLGISVIGNKVIVDQSPNMFIYTIDASGDRPVGPPEVIFTGFGGVNHDHGIHSGIVGPDGRYYFNMGNEGDHGDLIKYGNFFKEKAGQPMTDITGSEFGLKATKVRGHDRAKGEIGFREGLAMSMNLDGSEIEVLGYNFRNNYELAIDSFGTVWQSDNDDDGNQGACINYVMEGGNFGYTGPTGTNWNRDMTQFANVFKGQTHQEAQWHQRWPGVVPNLLNTGQGAPCGMIVYEGDLLPEVYRGMVLHCDAGPNVVRAYITKFGAARPAGIAKPVTIETAEKWLKDGDAKGGGYEAKEVELMSGKAGDSWFRPDDICVAPDGAVYVSDWYDPNVGGHNTADTGTKQLGGWTKLHGRIYRLAPVGYTPASVKPMDLTNVKGMLAALNSPNLATRYFGFSKLADQLKGNQADAAIKELQTQFETSKNPFLRARALWLLTRAKDGEKFVNAAIKDSDPNIRITGIRTARRMKGDVIKIANEMLGDSSMAVLREVCLAMQFQPLDKSLPVLLKLADKYDGKDRWYLEAFGIGCAYHEKEVLAAYEANHKGTDPVTTGILWRLKLEPTQPSDADQASATPIDQPLSSWRAVGPFPAEGPAALDTAFGPEKSLANVDMNASYTGLDGKEVKWEKLAIAGGFGRGGRGAAGGPPAAPGAAGGPPAGGAPGARPAAGAGPTTNPAAARAGAGGRGGGGGFGRGGPRVIDLAQFSSSHGFRTNNIVGYFTTAIVSDKDQQITLAFGSSDDCKIWLNGTPVLTRKGESPIRLVDDSATLNLKKGKNVLLVKLVQTADTGGMMASIYAPVAVTSTDDFSTTEASPSASAGVTPAPAGAGATATSAPATGFVEKQLKSKDGQILPPMAELAKLEGDPERGALVFQNTMGANCVKCHQIGEVGQMIGPPLTVVGNKLQKPQIYEAILYPSAQILMEFETWVVRDKNGEVFTGLKVEDTPDHVTIKDTDAKYHDIPVDQIDRKVMQKISLMPEGLNETMTKQDLVDLVEFLSSQKG